MSLSLLTASLGTTGVSVASATSKTVNQIPMTENVQKNSAGDQVETKGAVSWTYNIGAPKDVADSLAKFLPL